MSDLKITIGDVSLNDFSDKTSFYLVRSTPELLSTVSVNRTSSPRQGQHGVFDSLSFYGERTLPFDGELVALTPTARRAMEDALRRAVALPTIQSYAGSDGYVPVRFTDEDGTLKQCYAKIAEPPSFGLTNDLNPRRRTFSFTMVAKDPILYGQTLKSASLDETTIATSFTIVQGVTFGVPFSIVQTGASPTVCENEGTYGSPPVITINGTTDSPKIVNQTTSQFLHLDGLALAAGEYVVIDVNAKSITLSNGGDASAYLSSDSEWWVLAPGENEIYLIDDTTAALDATATVQWRDCWL